MTDDNQYLFGPVASRRLGMSLGIDLVPYKTCSLNCVYCESGETTSLTAQRREYVPTNDVIQQLDKLLSTDPHIDYLTFSGAGEPTLHSGIGKIVDFIKTRYPQYKICLLTNATMLGRPEIFEEINRIDLIVPSLDAGCNAEYLQINRPAESCDYDSYLAGLIDFSKKFSGEMWLEIFIVPGVNDSEAAIQRFAELTRNIKPDKVQLNTLDRPGCVPWIKAATPETIMRFVNVMEKISPVEAVGAFKYKTPEVVEIQSPEDAKSRIMQLIARRPCTAQDMRETLGVSSDIIEQALNQLHRQNSIKIENSQRGKFFRPA